MTYRASTFFAAFALSLTLAAPAFADVAPPNSTECDSLSAGDACKDDAGKDGACTKDTCEELDYSMGTPPTTKTVDCLICKAGTSSSSSSSSGGTTASKSTTTTKSDDSGCAVGRGSSAAGGLALAAAALMILARRRR